jgi:hypothetical protein
MEEATIQSYEARSSKLRAELKQFEADWASRNGGKKPGRQDIKQNPSIGTELHAITFLQVYAYFDFGT